uniref:N-acetyltransferase domain-containing protein n=1 Tax=Plectus sambesii TaxID=2011161 RepID=A0A914UUR3_9BILA
MSFTIIPATTDHAAVINSMTHELAEFEKLPKGPELSENELREAIAEKNLFGFVALIEEQVVGFVMCYYGFSTWQGKFIFMEDLYVRLAHRKGGIGKALWKEVAKVAFEQNLRRIQWTVLDWNTNAINFYKSIGATDMHDRDGWLDFRLFRPAIAKFVGGNSDNGV